VLLLASCRDFKHLDSRSKLMLKTKEQLFRGLDFDKPIDEVKKSETLQPEMQYADYLKYRIGADSIAAGESVEIEYFFNKKNQLDLMIAFYNISDSAAIHSMADNLMGYLETKYGRPKRDELGWYHWEFECKSGEPGTVEVNLVGETEKDYMGVELELIKYYSYEKRLSASGK